MVILNIEKQIQIFLKTKHDQALYSYKNIWDRNDSNGILGKKDKDTMEIVSSLHIFVRVQYLIIFSSQKDSDFFAPFLNCYFFSMSIDVFSMYQTILVLYCTPSIPNLIDAK
jgi:hypothetical protein